VSTRRQVLQAGANLGGNVRTICAWCDKPMEETAAMIKGTSYGICDECLEVVLAEYEAREEAEIVELEAQSRTWLADMQAKAQAARDNAAPADTPTGMRVDR